MKFSSGRSSCSGTTRNIKSLFVLPSNFYRFCTFSKGGWKWCKALHSCLERVFIFQVKNIIVNVMALFETRHFFQSHCNVLLDYTKTAFLSHQIAAFLGSKASHCPLELTGLWLRTASLESYSKSDESSPFPFKVSGRILVLSCFYASKHKYFMR